MRNDSLSINLLFPVLNEQLRLEKGIENSIEYLRNNIKIPYQLTILDNGSDDKTPEIGIFLQKKYSEVTYVRIEERGVGATFRRGIELNQCSIVGYMDIDLSTDLKYLGKTIELFQQDQELQYINGSRFSKESDTRGRKWYRRLISRGLVFLLKLFFNMKATDAVCGFTWLRKEAAEELARESSKDNGWFYTIEFLLRAERKNMKMYDMPVEWQEDYNTTVKIWKTIKNYIIRIFYLKKAFYLEDKKNRS